MDARRVGVSDGEVVLAEWLNAHRDLDRNARRFFPGLYEGWAHARNRELGSDDSSILVIDAQEEKAITSMPRVEGCGELLSVDVVGGTRDKRRRGRRAARADVEDVVDACAAPVRHNTRHARKARHQGVRAHADKENVAQKNGDGHSGRMAPEQAGLRGQGATSGKRAPMKSRTIPYADLRADAKMMGVEAARAFGRLSRKELTRAIADHVPQMTVAQLIQACDRKHLSLGKPPRGPRKKDYVALLVNHYVDA